MQTVVKSLDIKQNERPCITDPKRQNSQVSHILGTKTYWIGKHSRKEFDKDLARAT